MSLQRSHAAANVSNRYTTACQTLPTEHKARQEKEGAGGSGRGVGGGVAGGGCTAAAGCLQREFLINIGIVVQV